MRSGKKNSRERDWQLQKLIGEGVFELMEKEKVPHQNGVMAMDLM